MLGTEGTLKKKKGCSTVNLAEATSEGCLIAYLFHTLLPFDPFWYPGAARTCQMQDVRRVPWRQHAALLYLHRCP